MHNCKATRKRLIEQALDKTPSDQSEQLQVELDRCPECREELASLRRLLRVADQAMQSVLPDENFWSRYHARLQEHLESGSESAVTSCSRYPRTESGLRTSLRKLIIASVPVPVPLAAVLVVLFGMSLLFAMNSRRSSKGAPLLGSASVVTKIVEVPVTQERTITRVVYRERSLRASRGKASQPERTDPNAVVARNEPAGTVLVSLAGFKPTNEVKLTIIKGSYEDEK